MPPALPTGAIVASAAWNIPVLKKCSSVVRRSTSESCEPGGVSTSDTQRGSSVTSPAMVTATSSTVCPAHAVGSKDSRYFRGLSRGLSGGVSRELGRGGRRQSPRHAREHRDHRRVPALLPVASPPH